MADPKSRADLEVELERAQQAKIAAEDRLTTDRLSPLTEHLTSVEAKWHELEEGYNQAMETKQALEAELAEAQEAINDVETVNEELQENDTLIASLNEQLDNKIAEIQDLSTQIAEIKAEYDVRAEEVQMALLSNERTELLERRMSVMEGRFNELVTDLQQAELAADQLQTQIDEAADARSSAESILEDVEGRLSVDGLEAQIVELNAAIEEKRQALDNTFDVIESLRGEIATVSEEVEADQTTVSEQGAAMQSLKEQLANYVEPPAPVDEELNALLAKIGQCTSSEELCSLEESFNHNGLTLQETTNGRKILCKLREGQAITEDVINDFIFINDRFSQGAVDKIYDFVTANAGFASEFKDARAPITIINEDKHFALDALIESQRVI